MWLCCLHGHLISFPAAMFDWGIKGMTPTVINELYESVTPVLATVMNIAVLVAGVFGMFIAHFVYRCFIRNESLAILIFFLSAFHFVCLLLFVGEIRLRMDTHLSCCYGLSSEYDKYLSLLYCKQIQ